MTIPGSAREFIESGRLAHLVTINRDGSPQVTIVWAGLDGDEIVIAHLGGHEYQKLKNIRRDPRVTFSMEGTGIDEHGVTPYLVVHGTARIEEGEIAGLMTRLAETYMGTDAHKLKAGEFGPGYITRITPRRIGGIGPWTGEA